MRNVLFVTPALDSKTGGGIVSAALRSVVQGMSASFHEVSLLKPVAAKEKMRLSLQGFLQGMNPEKEKEIDGLISSCGIDTVVFNTSYYGQSLRKLKKKYPSVRFICFFHNVEVLFIRDFIKESKQLASLLTLAVAWHNERLAARFADAVVCLNRRDAGQITRIYHRKPDAIAPLSLEDHFDETRLHAAPDTVGAFIGSNFYANYYGVKWFAENVAPHISTKILIIGKGFEKCRNEFAGIPNMEVIGTVDDVSRYYYAISFIVSPIFLGSGMKTKTAEALMYGKTVFGTTEAFQGYDVDFEKVGGLCNTAADFIRRINAFEKPANQFNPYSRRAFVEKYSLEAFRKIIQTIL